ncbi:MAG: hypothetical protein QOD93_4316, partial [Acetobacteraceae bacterium]|nr:hypothetical protein [Acetobacteraceae bacterium]
FRKDIVARRLAGRFVITMIRDRYDMLAVELA